MLAFFVPGEPVAKGRPRFVRATGRTFTPAKTANYEGVVADAASKAMDGREPFDGPLRVTIRATFLVPQSWSQKRKREAVWKVSRPDVENVTKACLDALNSIVYRDDAQVVELTAQKKYGPIAGLTVSIEPIPQHDGVA
jgi:Holliday junction resolvase RusA-like endonuclease